MWKVALLFTIHSSCVSQNKFKKEERSNPHRVSQALSKTLCACVCMLLCVCVCLQTCEHVWYVDICVVVCDSIAKQVCMFVRVMHSIAKRVCVCLCTIALPRVVYNCPHREPVASPRCTSHYRGPYLTHPPLNLAHKQLSIIVPQIIVILSHSCTLCPPHYCTFGQ